MITFLIKKWFPTALAKKRNACKGGYGSPNPSLRSLPQIFYSTWAILPLQLRRRMERWVGVFTFNQWVYKGKFCDSHKYSVFLKTTKWKNEGWRNNIMNRVLALHPAGPVQSLAPYGPQNPTRSDLRIQKEDNPWALWDWSPKQTNKKWGTKLIEKIILNIMNTREKYFFPEHFTSHKE